MPRSRRGARDAGPARPRLRRAGRDGWHSAGPDYAPIFHALVLLGEGRLDHDALHELQEKTPSDDPARIDQEWEEAPVTFTQHEMGGPTGMTAKLRAVGKAMVAARRSGGSQ